MREAVYQLVPTTRVPWGDYGAVLYHGISWHCDRVDGILQLERTGPYVPPLTLPSRTDVVVTSMVRDRLIASDLRGYKILPVAKRRVVFLDWQAWPDAVDPALYPAGGEPENYILRRKHHPATAREIGDLWELTAEASAQLRPGSCPSLDADLAASDFFVDSNRLLGLFVSKRAKSWLLGHTSKLLEFRRCAVTPHGRRGTK